MVICAYRLWFSALHDIDTIMVGLTNPDGISCDDGGCDGKLVWADGSDFSWNNSPIQNIECKSDTHWFKFKLSSRKFDGRTLTGKSDFACMSSCKGKINKPE